MPSTYSPNLRLELIASGEQGNTWGNTTNTNLGILLEKAITGHLLINTGFVGNTYTLSTRNGADDEARNMSITVGSGVTLSAQGTLIVPSVPKMYTVENLNTGGYGLLVRTSGGTGIVVPVSCRMLLMCDGIDIHQADTAGDYYTLANDPVSSVQAARKGYVDAKDATKLSLDGSLNMTGNLTLAGNPSANLHATPKQYVDANFVSKSTAVTQTMAAMLQLPRDPTGGDSIYAAATRNYVEAGDLNVSNWTLANFVVNTRKLIAGSGITVSGGGGAGGTLTGDVTITASGVAGVSSLAVVAPVQNTGTGQNPIIAMAAASAGADGYLTAAAYTSFSSKASTGDIAAAVANYLPLNGGTLTGSDGLTAKKFRLIDTSQNATRQLFLGYVANVPVLTSWSTNSSYAGFIIGQQWNNGSNSQQRIAIDGSGEITCYPNSVFTINGASVATGSKTFRIPHPIKPNTVLYHSAIEAPRCDLFYRGVVTLVKGQATVNIDAASFMSPGTFVALTQSAEVMNLHNQDSFWRVRATPIENGEFSIIAENVSCEDAIAWMVVAERADADIRKAAVTDDFGRLIPEHFEG